MILHQKYNDFNWDLKSSHWKYESHEGWLSQVINSQTTDTPLC